MRKFILPAMAIVVVMFFMAHRKPVEKAEKLKWMTLSEAEAAFKKERKPILIDLYTDWCGWCKVMDKETYTNKNVISYLEEKFYPVKLDAETKQSLAWGGKTYQFNSSYRTNDFAIFLTQGQLSYPTTVIIPADGSMPQPIPGYLKPSEIEIIVKYFGEGKFGKEPFDSYMKKFKASW